MTVDELGDRMSNLEFVKWRTLLARRAQKQQLAKGGAG